ncbi:hypothetical protein [Staphylococcus epidermidis]|uniref:hypothetical protein n=1 Tax=Staphylococcus epidermidis TaxID=1282 RepID=UPI0015C62406|nr:hypothetical protein [Staphylococcus epidermidis]
MNGNIANAQENHSSTNIKGETYEELIDQGIIDSSISKEQWNQFKAEDKYYAKQ